MWTISCDGDLFGGRRLWLRPGTTHLLGRTAGHAGPGERISYIEHKSVSRKHLLIHVSLVDPLDISRIHKRTAISVEDNSKVGSTLNEDKICKKAVVLEGKEYMIRLGNYEHVFHLVWRPVTLTCTASSRKAKGGNALTEQKERLAGTDIKLVTEYVSNETTHVIAKKRNTVTALQALVQARWVVTNDWLEALAAATQSSGTTANGDPMNSLLEEDFDTNWPKEENYIVPSAGEPVSRPSDYMKPNVERADVFQDFIFICLSASQHESLMPVITSGGGKALLRELEEDFREDHVEGLVDYVREVAGKKGSSEYRLSQQVGRGGVAVVRPQIDAGDERRRDALRAVEVALDQRSINQSELLDPILTLDTSGLRRQLPDEQIEPEVGIQAPEAQTRSAQLSLDQPEAIAAPESNPAEHASTSVQPMPEEQPAEQPVAVGRRYRRAITKSRYKNFDDFDPSQYTSRVSASPEPPAASVNKPSPAPSVQEMNIDEPSQSVRAQQSTHKRPAPIDEAPEEGENIYDSLLQGQAAMKRRKIEAARKGDKSAFSQSIIDADVAATDKAAKGKRKKVEKQIDVKAELAARRAREEEQRLKDDEVMREQMAGIDISELRNLAKIEEMEVTLRDTRSRGPGASSRSDRWDPAWDGRKNFKKFRAQGSRTDAPRLQRVIVTLDEVPRKGHGIGDEYWLSSTATAAGQAKSKSQSQSQTLRGAPSSDDAGDAARFRRRVQRSREQDAEDAMDETVHPAEIAGHARDPALEALANGTPSQTMATESQRKAAGKRPAVQQGGGPAKKARQGTLRSTAVVPVNDDDDDDGLKFKRRRR